MNKSWAQNGRIFSKYWNPLKTGIFRGPIDTAFLDNNGFTYIFQVSNFFILNFLFNYLFELLFFRTIIFIRLRNLLSLNLKKLMPSINSILPSWSTIKRAFIISIYLQVILIYMNLLL